MSKKVVVFSTLSSDQAYQRWAPGGGDLPIPDGEPIVIKGGANVADRRLITRKGTPTVITETQLAILLEDRHFQEHKKNGFITFGDMAPADADDVAASELKAKDESAPVTPEDFPKDGAGPKPAAKKDK